MKTAAIAVELIDHMGDDLRVANAARVSFAKHSETLGDGDERLIRYLARHDHWTPFAHCMATFRVKMPIFVARQLVKHTVGLAINEVSRRYVDSEPEVHHPDEWRVRAEDVKQGSGEAVEPGLNEWAMRWTDGCYGVALVTYREMIQRGVCPEQARMVLPLATMTSWYWTGSLAAFARVCRLRLAPDAQAETRRVAELVADHMARLFPVSWAALGASVDRSKDGRERAL